MKTKALQAATVALIPLAIVARNKIAGEVPVSASDGSVGITSETTRSPTSTTPSPAPTSTTSSTTTTSTTQVAAVHVQPAALTFHATSASSGLNWDRLADCESGAWDRNGNPIPGTANWQDVDGPFQGGVHFDYRTWDNYVSKYFPGYPADAQDASREQQIAVATQVLEHEGRRAWPVCSYKAAA